MCLAFCALEKYKVRALRRTPSSTNPTLSHKVRRAYASLGWDVPFIPSCRPPLCSVSPLPKYVVFAGSRRHSLAGCCAGARKCTCFAPPLSVFEAFSNTSCRPLQAATAAPLRAGVKGLARGSAWLSVAKGAREGEFKGGMRVSILGVSSILRRKMRPSGVRAGDPNVRKWSNNKCSRGWFKGFLAGDRQPRVARRLVHGSKCSKILWRGFEYYGAASVCRHE